MKFTTECRRYNCTEFTNAILRPAVAVDAVRLAVALCKQPYDIPNTNPQIH
jgi:hypothetical protein